VTPPPPDEESLSWPLRVLSGRIEQTERVVIARLERAERDIADQKAELQAVTKKLENNKNLLIANLVGVIIALAMIIFKGGVPFVGR
jgi:hypothetical protein